MSCFASEELRRRTEMDRKLSSAISKDKAASRLEVKLLLLGLRALNCRHFCALFELALVQFFFADALGAYRSG